MLLIKASLFCFNNFINLLIKYTIIENIIEINIMKVKYMFFIGVFGIENKQKEICEVNQLQCKNCEGVTSGKLYKTFQCFHFFFIPIIKWNEEYYLKCNSCRSIFRISSEKGGNFEKGMGEELTYWDLEEVKNNYGSDATEDKIICQSCGASIDNKYKYCPYCGNKM